MFKKNKFEKLLVDSDIFTSIDFSLDEKKEEYKCETTQQFYKFFVTYSKSKTGHKEFLRKVLHWSLTTAGAILLLTFIIFNVKGLAVLIVKHLEKFYTFVINGLF